MKCKKCGSQDVITKIVDIKNKKVRAPLITIILVIASIVAIYTGVCLANELTSNTEITEDFWKDIENALINSAEMLILAQVCFGSLVTVVACSLYIKLLPFKVIPVKKTVCTNCGAEQNIN